MKNRYKKLTIVRLVSVCLILLALTMTFLSVYREIIYKLTINAIENSDYQALKRLSKMPFRIENKGVVEDIKTILFDIPGKNNLFPIELAVEKNDIKSVQILLDNGFDPDVTHIGYVNHTTVLEDAVAFGNVPMCKLLVEKGAKKCNGYGGLSQYVRLSGEFSYFDTNIFTELFKILQENGFLNNSEEDSTIWEQTICYASIMSNKEVLDFLVKEYSTNFWSYISKNGETPIIWCCQSKHCVEATKIDFVLTALKNGCNCNVGNSTGKTAYDYAIENGYYELAELIKPNSDGVTE